MHIADATANTIKESGVGAVGLLGTKFTMEQDFYVHRVIYEELCLGQVKSESRDEYLGIIDDLHRRGAEAVIEGCTEIDILVKQERTNIPLFDTTTMHAQQAVLDA